jgi:hypothetical protein
VLPVHPEHALSWRSGFGGGAHARPETTPVHHAHRRRDGCVAARSTRTAEDTNPRLPRRLTPQPLATQLAAFTAALNASGYVDSTSVHIEYRWAEGEYERLPGLAADLIAHLVAVLFATGGAPGALAATAASRTTPIVFYREAIPCSSALLIALPDPAVMRLASA